MDKKILNEFIDKICDMTGMECYEEELDNHVGKIELRFWGSSEVGVQVSSHLDKFSIYVPFSFEDYGKDEIESDNFDVEDLEIEKRTALHKNLFYLWCQNRELIYPITEWDDGAYMCPGYVAWVGYCNIPYCDDAVLNFVKLVNEYEEVYGQYANQKLREEIVSLLCKNKGIYVTIGRNIILGKEAKAVLLTAQELKSPVILGVSEGAGKYMTGFKTVAAMVKAMDEELGITVPVALHLDHGTYEGCYKCIKAGFTSIMFDGSHYSIEENIEKTKELVAVAHRLGLSIEAEVGSIGGEEDGVIGMGECADPNECKAIADLGVDMLAAGIGNIHGKYPANWAGLSFETLAAVQEKTGALPLVLHGGTGIPEDMIKKAIELGVSKINVNTECQLSFADATRKYIEAGKDLEGKGFDPRKLLAPGTDAIKATVKEKMELFGSVGKAE